MTSTAQPPYTPAGMVGEARSVLGGLDEVMWAAKTPAELLAAKVELERLRSQLAAADVQVSMEIEASKAAQTEEWASTPDYLTRVAGGRRGHGSRLLRTARALTGDLQATWLALREGEISPEQAEVITRVVAKLPVNAALRARAEVALLEQAVLVDASELAGWGDKLLEVLDPDGCERRDEQALDRSERSAHLNRFLSIREDGLGGAYLKGRGTVEDVAVVKSALASLSAPLPATDPDCGLEGSDPRDHSTRTWDALVEACQRLSDAEVLPEDHGAKPRVTVTIDIDALRTGLGAAVLDTGERLSAAAVRKLACDAELIPAVLGNAGEVLDVGRTQRLVTAAIWKAVVLRDRHCRFPGCRRPPIACDAHHLTHWADGGPTSLDNLVLLCRAHHTVIHCTGWQVRLNRHDRRPEFRPPTGRRRLTPEFAATLDWTDDWVRERVART